MEAVVGALYCLGSFHFWGPVVGGYLILSDCEYAIWMYGTPNCLFSEPSAFACNSAKGGTPRCSKYGIFRRVLSILSLKEEFKCGLGENAADSLRNGSSTVPTSS